MQDDPAHWTDSQLPELCQPDAEELPTGPEGDETGDGQSHEAHIDKSWDSGGIPVEKDSGYVRAEFVKAVVADKSLSMDEGGANRVFDYMIAKVTELGVTLGPQEMLAQFVAPHAPVLALPRNDGGDDEPPIPMSSKPMSPKEIEDIQEEWDSSVAPTKSPGSPWTEEEPTLEGKVARVRPEDVKGVALMHAVGEERKARREEKKKNKENQNEEKVEEAGSDIRWSPLTRGGFQDFLDHCSGRKSAVPPQTLRSNGSETKQNSALGTGHIKWGPITKEGLASFTLNFAQVELAPEKMNFAELVEYSISLEDVVLIPEDTPTQIKASVRYIKELYDVWGIADYEDMEWYLDDGWGNY